MRDRKLNTSNNNERSFRKKNSKANNSKLIINNNNTNNEGLNSDGNDNNNSNFKNELKNFLEENNKFESLKTNNIDKQKIIEINEEEEEKSVDVQLNLSNKPDICDDKENNMQIFDNSKEKLNKIGHDNIQSDLINEKKSIKNPLEKFQNLYLQAKTESSSKVTDNKNVNLKYSSQEVINHVSNDEEIHNNKDNEITSTDKIESISIPKFDNQMKKHKKDSYSEEKELEDQDNNYEANEENGEIEEIFNNFEEKVAEAKIGKDDNFISAEHMIKMEKDQLIKYILNSDLVKEKNNDNDPQTDLVNNFNKDNFEENDLNNKNKKENIDLNNFAKNKFSFAPRKKNIESNENELLSKKPNLAKATHEKNNKLNQPITAKEKALSSKKIINQSKKEKENSVNKLNVNSKNKAKNNEQINKLNKNVKKNNIEHANDKDPKLASKDALENKAKQIDSEINPLFDNNEKIEKFNQNDNNISEGILNEIEHIQEELDSKQILEMLLYNKTQLENEINQVIIITNYF